MPHDDRAQNVVQPPRGKTLQDVASATGVTISTVSKALNNSGKLRQSTRERIRAEARRMGVRFHDLSQVDATTRRLLIAVLTTDMYGRFSMPILTGINAAFEGRQISALLSYASSPLEEQKHIDLLLARKVDGIIVTARREDLRPKVDLRNKHIPVVYAFSQADDSDALSVLTDDAQGACIAIEHLVQCGRRNFAHITGPGHFEAVRLREAAMRQTLNAHGIALPEHRVITGPWQEQWGSTGIKFLLDQDPSIDAVFCGSDQIARGVIEMLHERQIRVPDDIAVVGFD